MACKSQLERSSLHDIRLDPSPWTAHLAAWCSLWSLSSLPLELLAKSRDLTKTFERMDSYAVEVVLGLSLSGDNRALCQAAAAQIVEVGVLVLCRPARE